MRCETCQHQNAEDANFCVNCGTTLAQTCPSCARRSPPISRFCAHCGAKLHGEEHRHDHLTPTEPTASVLSTRAARDGERKRITVLFADIVGSTALVEQMDPEDAATLLAGATHAM